MKKYTIIILSCAIVLAVAFAAVAQQDAEQRRQTMQQSRQAQQKAIADLEAGLASLKALNQQTAPAMQDRQQMQNMSEEDRARLRETFTQRRRQQTDAMQAIENSVAVLQGGRQIRLEHRQAMSALQAIKDIAVEEKAQKTIDAIEKLMAEKQKAFEEKMTELGLPAAMPQMRQAGQRPEGAQRPERGQRPEGAQRTERGPRPQRNQ